MRGTLRSPSDQRRSSSPSDQRRPRGVHGRLGEAVLDVFGRLALTVSVGFSALWFMLRPRTWRRTVRAEFVRQCWRFGITGLPAIILAGIVVGALMMHQVRFWDSSTGGALGAFKVGTLVMHNYVREFTPVLIGLIVAGRSGTVITTELVAMRIGGQLRLLEGQGIDLFEYLVVPRLSALILCMFGLSMCFVTVGLVAGHLMATLTGLAERPLLAFLKIVAQLFSPSDYLNLLIKPAVIGVVIGAVACVTALRPPLDGRYKVENLLPLGFMRSVVATLVASVAVNLVV